MSLCGIFSDIPPGAQPEVYPPAAAYPFSGYPVTAGQKIRLHSEYQNNTGFAQTDVMGIMLPWFAIPAPQYPRPGGGTPLRVPLVPEYNRCTSPNSNHISPLNSPSCSPPVESSQVLTTASTGRQSASARYDVLVGNPSTPADEANVRIVASATDVICKATNAACPGGAGTDYTGRVVLATTMRITDRQSGAAEAGTVVERELYAPFTCVANGTAVGSTCTVYHYGRRAGAELHQRDEADRHGDGERHAQGRGAERHRLHDRLPPDLRRRRRGCLPAPGSVHSLRHRAVLWLALAGIAGASAGAAAASPTANSAADSRAPSQTIFASSSQKAGRLYLLVTLHERGTLRITASAAGTRYKGFKKSVAPHIPSRVYLKLSASALRSVKRSIKRKTVYATVKSVGSDQSGNRRTYTKRIKLRS